MDTKFQTSFIPKKSSIVEQKTIKHGKSTNIFTILAILIFAASVGGAVFCVIWKGVLTNIQIGYQKSLEQKEKDFEAEAMSLNKLKASSAKLQLGKTILGNHVASSEIFDTLSKLTIEGIKFDSLEFGSGLTPNVSDISIELKGVGSSFSAIAYQSDVFGQPQKFGANKVLRNPIVKDLIINENGSIGFTFMANISPVDISYEKSLGSISQ
jgi:hypothetical protein